MCKALSITYAQAHISLLLSEIFNLIFKTFRKRQNNTIGKEISGCQKFGEMGALNRQSIGEFWGW